MYSGTFSAHARRGEADEGPSREQLLDAGHRAVLALRGHSHSGGERPEGVQPAGNGGAVPPRRARSHRHRRALAQRLPGSYREEFLEFLSAVAASGPGVPNPPVAAFLATHPNAKAFAEAAKPIPASFARQAFFAITAFKFINAAGESKFGRFRMVPDAGAEFLTAEQAATKTSDFLAAEFSQRLAKGPVGFRIRVQLAEQGDDVANASVAWPESRPVVDFGSLTITERVDELDPEMRKVIFDPCRAWTASTSAGDPLTEVRSEICSMSGRRRRAGRGELISGSA